jgi:hypothetical protein
MFAAKVGTNRQNVGAKLNVVLIVCVMSVNLIFLPSV